MSKLNVPAVAARGYDLVSYFSGQAQMGDPALSAEHDGVLFYFASNENKEQFEANPAQFMPEYGGWCAYAMSEGKHFDVDPTSFKVADGKLYLFYKGVGGDTIQFWNENEAERVQKAKQVWAG